MRWLNDVNVIICAHNHRVEINIGGTDAFDAKYVLYQL